MKTEELSGLLIGAVKKGAGELLLKDHFSEDFMTKQDAFKLFGRSTVERWIKEKLLIPLLRDGKVVKKCIERKKLHAIAAKSNRISYLPVAER